MGSNQILFPPPPPTITHVLDPKNFPKLLMQLRKGIQPNPLPPPPQIIGHSWNSQYFSVKVDIPIVFF